MRNNKPKTKILSLIANFIVLAVPAETVVVWAQHRILELPRLQLAANVILLRQRVRSASLLLSNLRTLLLICTHLR
jgi:hypothetical protein